MKAIEILGMWWDNGSITFSTTDGRDGRVYFMHVAEAMTHYGSSFENYLGNAWKVADRAYVKTIFDSFGWIIKEYIEKFVYKRYPEIIIEKSQD